MLKYLKELFYPPLSSVRHPDNKFRRLADKVIATGPIYAEAFPISNHFRHSDIFSHVYSDDYGAYGAWGYIHMYHNGGTRIKGIYQFRLFAVIDAANALKEIDEEMARENLSRMQCLLTTIETEEDHG